ncbi:MAG: phytoene desaturase family protein [Pseudomonadota bacterium]
MNAPFLNVPHRPVRDGRPHAVVIGSGVGGLAAAARLSAKGYRVTVLEKLDAPGGRAYVRRQDGFTFDMGPTIITAPHVFEDLWRAAGGDFHADIDLRPCDPFYKIRFDDGSVFTYSADRDRMRAEIAKFEPKDVPAYDRFMEASGKIFEVAFAELADKPFHSLAFTMRTMADLVRLGGYRTVHDRVSDFFTNEKLKIVFSFHPLLIGGNPFTTTAYYCLIAHLESKHGVHYTVGGTGAIVRGLVDLIEKNGGAVRCEAEVSRILVENGRASGVELANGEHVHADLVVSNADPAWTYGELLKDHPRKRWTDAKLDRAAYSMSLFVWYFGTDRTYPEVGHHTMVLGPRYKGLLDDIFVNHAQAEDFSLYLHRPTASDPSLAPEGSDAFYVLAPVPNLRSGVDWTKHAGPFRAMIERRLEETLLPGLGDAIVTSHHITPLDFRDRLLSYQGAAFAMEPKLFQSAWFRPHNRSEEVEGLYLVGAGTHPGAGLPGVVSSAKVVADLIPAAVAK